MRNFSKKTIFILLILIASLIVILVISIHQRYSQSDFSLSSINGIALMDKYDISLDSKMGGMKISNKIEGEYTIYEYQQYIGKSLGNCARIKFNKSNIIVSIYGDIGSDISGYNKKIKISKEIFFKTDKNIIGRSSLADIKKAYGLKYEEVINSDLFGYYGKIITYTDEINRRKIAFGIGRTVSQPINDKTEVCNSITLYTY